MIFSSEEVSRFRKDVEAIIAEDSLRSSIISEVRGQQLHGQPFDVQSLLDERPDLGERKSIVLELAYEEFCQRTEAGESVDPERFCKRFPAFEESLRKLVEIHAFLDENPQLLPDDDVDWPEPGQTFLGFSILAELGRGAFARVFLAEEVALGRRLVAVKVSIEGTLEAEILGKLQHPNIVPVHSVRQDPQTRLTAVCMPFLGQITLFDVMARLFGGEKKKPTRSRAIIEAIRHDAGDTTSTDDANDSIDGELYHGSYIDGALHLGSQLAEALAYSHARGISHCDLKPSNVMVTPGGRPMLLDFNLAFDSQTMDGRLGGTLPYMAPEQLRAMGGAHEPRGAVGERSDIFSLGVILYELFTGTRPFGPIATNRPCDEIRTSLLERQRLGPRRLRSANKEVEPRLAKILESCLAFAPDKRPQCAAELAEALRASRSTGHRVERWARRHWLLAFGGLACFSFAGIATGHYFVTRDPREIRIFNRGGRAYQAGDYAEAEECFKWVTNTTKSNELLADAFFWRGRACLQLKYGPEAMRYFGKAATLRRDGATIACYAYACARWKFDTTCINRSRQAINAGFATAEVYNNVGYSQLQEGEFDSAIENLNQAINLAPGMKRAYHNRAFAEFLWAIRQRRPVDLQAAEDINCAIGAGSENPFAYYDAALIYSRLDEDPDRHGRRIVGYLCDALQRGLSPKIVRMNFPSFVSDADVKQALTVSVPVIHRGSANQLADPLPNQPFPFR